MAKVGTRSLVAGVAMCLVLMLVLAATCEAALFGILKSRSRNRAPAVVKQSLMIFPFDRDVESAVGVTEDFGQGIAEYLRTSLAPSKGYSTLLFDKRLAPVMRALGDNVVKNTEVTGPFFTDKAKADKLAGLVATDLYVIGSVESYTYDKDKKTAEIMLKADLVIAKSGKVSQEFMVGGSAAQGAQPLDEEELQSIAAGKAVEALAQKILETSAADAKPAPKKDK